MAVYHEPALLEETIDLLVTDLGGTYIDATFGGGGHTRGILSRLGKKGRVIAFDVDDNSRRVAEDLSSTDNRLSFVQKNFSYIDDIRKEGPFSGFLFDLGVSSYQIDSEEGFSYRRNERLDMRLDRKLGTSAYEVVNSYSADELADVFFKYAEEPRSRALARAILKARETGRVETTAQLAAVMSRVCGGSAGTLSRLFQAIRIEVNGELDSLKAGLDAAVDLAAIGARIAVISYHSLEDRIVKEKFKYEAASCICPPEAIICTCGKTARVKVLTRKPIVPGEAEIKRNRRARSAKLRVAEKIS